MRIHQSFPNTGAESATGVTITMTDVHGFGLMPCLRYVGNQTSGVARPNLFICLYPHTAQARSRRFPLLFPLETSSLVLAKPAVVTQNFATHGVQGGCVEDVSEAKRIDSSP